MGYLTAKHRCFAAVKKRSKMKILHALPVILMSTFIYFSSLFASEAIYTDWIKESDVVICIDSEDRYTVEKPNVFIGNIKEVGAILPREVKKCTIIISKNIGKTKKSNIEKKEVSETLIRLLSTLGCSEYKIFQAAGTLAGMGEIK